MPCLYILDNLLLHVNMEQQVFQPKFLLFFEGHLSKHAQTYHCNIFTIKWLTDGVIRL